MVAPAPRRFWNVPNSLTVSRLVLAVGVFLFIEYQFYLSALALFLIAAITDALDGYFARLLKQDTKIGRQLDPLIDKVIVSGCYIYLATISGTGVKAWMVSAIVIRLIVLTPSEKSCVTTATATTIPTACEAWKARPIAVPSRKL